MVHVQGCKDKLITLAKDKAKILIALGFGVALLEVSVASRMF
jgi:hypothetical protein